MAKFLKGIYKSEAKADEAKTYASGQAGRMARSSLLSMGKSFPKMERPSSEAVRYGKGGKP